MEQKTQRGEVEKNGIPQGDLHPLLPGRTQERNSSLKNPNGQGNDESPTMKPKKWKNRK